MANPVTGGVARVFYFDDYDSAVYWNNTDADVGSDLTNQGTVTTGIIAGQKYCVGIQASDPENDTYDGAENTRRNRPARHGTRPFGRRLPAVHRDAQSGFVASTERGGRLVETSPRVRL